LAMMPKGYISVFYLDMKNLHYYHASDKMFCEY